jgi:hypothetical protein
MPGEGGLGSGFAGGLFGGAVASAFVELFADTTRLQKDFNQAKTTTEAATGQISAKTKAMQVATSTAALVAGAAIVRFGQQAYESYKRHQTAAVELQHAIDKFPSLAGASEAAFQKQAIAERNLTGAHTDEVIAADAVLARFKLTQAEILRTLPLVVDYAQATGKSIPDAADVVGKAILGNTRALREIGIRYKVTGDSGKDFNAILTLMQQKIGGVAAAWGKTAEGRAEIMRAQLDDLKASGGALIAEALNPIVRALSALLNAIDGLPSPIKTTVLAVVGLTTVLGGGLYLISQIQGALALFGISFGKAAVEATAANTEIAASSAGAAAEVASSDAEVVASNEAEAVSFIETSGEGAAAVEAMAAKVIASHEEIIASNAAVEASNAELSASFILGGAIGTSGLGIPAGVGAIGPGIAAGASNLLTGAGLAGILGTAAAAAGVVLLVRHVQTQIGGGVTDPGRIPIPTGAAANAGAVAAIGAGPNTPDANLGTDADAMARLAMGASAATPQIKSVDKALSDLEYDTPYLVDLANGMDDFRKKGSRSLAAIAAEAGGFDASVLKTSTNVQAFLKATGQSYTDFHDKAERAANGQLISDSKFIHAEEGYWKRYRDSIAVTFDGMSSALQSFSGDTNVTARQIDKAFTNELATINGYERDWKTVVARSKGHNKDFLAALEQMGLDGSGIVHALATTNDREFNRIMGKWTQGKHASKDLATTIADTLVGTMHDLIDTIRQALGLPAINWHFNADLSKAKSDVQAFLDVYKREGVKFGTSVSFHGGGGSDREQLAWVLEDEFIVNPAASKKWKVLLEAINADAYHSGGMVGGSTSGDVPGYNEAWRALLGATKNLRGTLMSSGFNTAAIVVPLAAGSASGTYSGGDPYEADMRSEFPNPAEFSAAETIVRMESGYNPFAQNPVSTAFGRWQFLDSTWGTVGGFKTTRADLQDEFGRRYVQGGHYPSAQAALAHELKFHWYDEGGWLDEPVLGVGQLSGKGYGFAGKGKPEAVLTSDQMQQLGKDGSVHVHATIPITVQLGARTIAREMRTEELHLSIASTGRLPAS